MIPCNLRLIIANSASRKTVPKATSPNAKSQQDPSQSSTHEKSQDPVTKLPHKTASSPPTSSTASSTATVVNAGHITERARARVRLRNSSALFKPKGMRLNVDICVCRFFFFSILPSLFYIPWKMPVAKVWNRSYYGISGIISWRVCVYT